MKTMKSFAAQQLTKKQMNAVSGGDVIVLECMWADGRYTIMTIDQLDEAINSGGNCFPV